MKPHRPVARDLSSDLRAIKQLAAAWRAGWLGGDADALLALYADNPVLMPQGSVPVTGKPAIRALYKAVLDEFTFESTGRLMEVEASGDWGFFWSTYNLIATQKAGGKSFSSSGKSVFIVKRTPAGAWKIARLIDNTNAPTRESS